MTNPASRVSVRRLTRRRLATQLAVALSTASAFGASHAAGSLHTLAPYAGGPGTFVLGLSGNGQTAVGASYAPTASNSDTTPVIWQDGTPNAILAGSPLGFATSVSRDGSVVVGGYIKDGDNAATAFRWTEAAGTQDLGRVSTAAGSGVDHVAWDVSDSGNVVVGAATPLPRADVGLTTIYEYDNSLALRWDDNGVNVLTTSAGAPSFGGDHAKAMGISGDGSTIVGYSTNAAGEMRAFRWTNPTDGMTELGHLGGGLSYAIDVSNDGSAIAGTSTTGATDITMRAFRWTSAGMVNLGSLEKGLPSQANAISGDGTVVVGHAGVSDPNTTDPWGRPVAFRWSETGGMESVAQWLAKNGVTISDNTKLASATATNDDGSVVAGNADADENGPSSSWIARSTPTQSGIIEDVVEYRESVAQTAAATSQATASLPNLALFGSHHRPLRLSAFTQTGADGVCAWATGDAARQNDREVDVQLAEAGVCTGIGSSVIGIGVGQIWAEQDLELGGSADFDGQYIVAEGDYLMPNDLLLSALAYYGRFDGEIKRNYRNGADIETSIGKPDTTGTAARLRADWLDVAAVGNVSLTPYVSYTWSNSKQDAYQEQRGFDPLSINEVEWETNDVRVGLGGTMPLTGMTTMHVAAELAHRFEDSTSGVEITDSITGPISLAGSEIDQTWGRVTVDIDHKLTKRHAITIGANAASDGADPTWGLTIGWRGSF